VGLSTWPAGPPIAASFFADWWAGSGTGETFKRRARRVLRRLRSCFPADQWDGVRKNGPHSP
jgi:hypothetical protein